MVWPREFRGTEATSHKQEKNSVGKRGKTIIWRGKTIFWRGPGVVPAWSPPPRICGACRGKKTSCLGFLHTFDSFNTSNSSCAWLEKYTKHA